MKKYIITLAAMALAIGGSINFAGCSGEPDIDPEAIKGDPEPTSTGESDADKEAAKAAGFDIGNEDAPEGTGEAPKK